MLRGVRGNVAMLDVDSWINNLSREVSHQCLGVLNVNQNARLGVNIEGRHNLNYWFKRKV